MTIHLAKQMIKVLSLVWCLLLGGYAHAHTGEEEGGKTPNPNKPKVATKAPQNARPATQIEIF
jgi:hypothetical protein